VQAAAISTKPLLKYDLVDEFWLKNFPLVLARGKTLFAEGTIPAAFKCSEACFTAG